ncbi:MAG: right-handed parallel beta-helix repeat-containing protein [bacterium]|nr:right-handed parallel beta-helix repeat-containing protein [bacterium]
MKRFIGLLVGTQFIVSSLVNATNVSGVISTNTVWNTAGSPYIVTGNILVDTLVRLDIQPGVEVRLDSAKCIMVKGFLNALGTASDSIIITKNGTAEWSRIWLKPAVICSLKYCRIGYTNNFALYTDIGDSIYMDHCTISNNIGGAIHINGGISVITNNTITDNSFPISGLAAGITIGGGTSAVITQNIISNNSNGGYGGGISIYGLASDGSITITKNTITNNSAMLGGGMCIWTSSNGSSVKIDSNTITYNSATSGGGGILINGSNVTVTNNTLSNNFAYQGGAIWSGAAMIRHNTITYNMADSGGGAIYTCSGTPSPIYYNTIIDTSPSAIYNQGEGFIRTNNISATGYVVYNTGGADLDARYNYWNITNTDTINAKIFDYFDDFNKGIVHYQIFLNAPFSDTIAPSAPINLTATKIVDSTFEINWTNPVDASGISEYYYHLSWSPMSNFDTSGAFYSLPDTITVTPGESLFVWLVDSSGNLDYNNRAGVYIVGIEEQSNLDFGFRNLELKTNKNPFIKSTVISYSVPEYTNVLLTIYDLSGRTVRTLVDEVQKARSYEFNLDSRGLNTGAYFLVLNAGNNKLTKKIIVIK